MQLGVNLTPLHSVCHRSLIRNYFSPSINAHLPNPRVTTFEVML